MLLGAIAVAAVGLCLGTLATACPCSVADRRCCCHLSIVVQKQTSVYIANLTAMTVGSDPDGAPCPYAWVTDPVYPNPPEGSCDDTHPPASNLCVEGGSFCGGTDNDGNACNSHSEQTNCVDSGCAWLDSACIGNDDNGNTCNSHNEQTNCEDSGCDWHQSCLKSLLGDDCESDACTAEHCIALTTPGTCGPAELDDFQSCSLVEALETADACNSQGTQTGTPCVYSGEDWRCYVHFTTSDAQVVKGEGPAGNVITLPLKRCPLVSLPVVGEQYVFGITDTCGWRQGDFVALSEVPEAFLPILTGDDECPTVNTDGGGSVMLVIMLIVVFPIGSVILYALAAKFGPKSLFGKADDTHADAHDSTDHGKDANPIKKAPAAP